MLVNNDMYLYGSTENNQYHYDPLPPVETPYLDNYGADAAFSPSCSTAPPSVSPEDTPGSCHLPFDSAYSLDGLSYVSSSQISNMLSKGDPYEWSDNLLDPVFQFDGNPLKLVISNVIPPVPYSEESATPYTPFYEYSSYSRQQEVKAEDEEEQLFPPLPSPALKRQRIEDDEYVPSRPAKRRAAAIAATKKTNLEMQNRPYECPICSARFNRSYNLRTHQLTHDINRPKPFTCHLCEKGFARKHDRDRHVSAVHAGERLFACDLCHASFARKTYLTSHYSTNHPFH